MRNYLFFFLRLVVSILLLQTLFFKFTAAPESVYIFETIGMEPYGRIGSGIAELIAAILILLPSTVWIGAGLSAAIISGALFFHLSELGIEIQNDGGTLFYLALIVFAFSVIILWDQRHQIPLIKNLF
jgi:putative oxidoreductase